MNKPAKFFVIMFLLISLVPLYPATRIKAAANDWQQTKMSGCSGSYWLSRSRDGVLYCASQSDFREISLQTGQEKVINPKPYTIWFEDPANDLLFGFTSPIESDNHLYRSADSGQTWQQTNWDKPAGYTIPVWINIQTTGYGSPIYYANGIEGGHNLLLYKSTDAGKTWNNLNISGVFSDNRVAGGVALHPTNPNILYAAGNLVTDLDGNKTSLAVARSEDGGTSWQIVKSLSVDFATSRVSIRVPAARNANPDAVQVIFQYSPMPRYNYGKVVYYTSNDRGNNFSIFFQDDQAAGNSGEAITQMYDGTLLTAQRTFCSPVGSCAVMRDPQISQDGGKSWQNLSLKGVYQFYLTPAASHVIYAATLNVSTDQAPLVLYRSTDSGQTWTKLEGAPAKFFPTFFVSDYLPLRLVLIDDTNVYNTVDNVAGNSQTAAFSPIPNQDYYDQTRHNLAGVFHQYWQANGGLAQFGYPRTEVFRELNPSDGKIYPVQYFERNRFEWHIEYAGTRYEVLLGLLGVQMTDPQRAAANGAFNRFDNLNYPGGRYYPETGHNLRNSFKTYWEQNGGLSIYGYPISEEYNEKNPDDGKTYVVQYFERARFEWHPENAGTRYEVLLGLLGNSLLRQKGWLPQGF